MASVRLLNCTPCLCNEPTRSTRFLTLRPSRSNFQTTRVSPSRRISSNWPALAVQRDCHYSCLRKVSCSPLGSVLRSEDQGSDPDSRTVRNQSTYQPRDCRGNTRKRVRLRSIVSSAPFSNSDAICRKAVMTCAPIRSGLTSSARICTTLGFSP